MYINEFVAGVATTLVIEVAIILGIGIYITIKNNNGGKK